MGRGYDEQGLLQILFNSYNREVRNSLKLNYWLTRLYYLRGLGALFFLAGLILMIQGPSLIGPTGLMPVKKVVDSIVAQQGSVESVFFKYPSLLFYFYQDWQLQFMAALMMIGGLSLIIGYANWPLIFILWILQLSLVNGAGQFWSFGWETMLLEMTWLTFVFVHPWRLNVMSERYTVPTYLSLWPLLWMMFRLMFGAGLIKLRGDACWLDFTCMDYHYQTQPNPHFLSWFYHHLPWWFHRFEVLMTHFYELFVPFLFLLPFYVRRAGALLIMLFQLTLISTGNLAFLNWQTMVLALVALDDRVFYFMQSPKRLLKLDNLAQLRPSTLAKGFQASFLLVVLGMSYWPVKNMISPKQRMNESYQSLHLINSYGLFGSITKDRYEIVISGTSDQELSESSQWQEYEFKCKPGAIDQAPCWVTPYHLRLDWQMWFSAMRPQLGEQWLAELARMMLENNAHLDQLIKENPFRDTAPPRHIKMDLYLYRFSDGDEKGLWWRREFKKAYLPPVNLSNFRPN